MCLVPEGVEVKLSADVIRPLIVDKKVYHVYVGPNSRYKASLPDGLTKFERGCHIVSVDTHGKFMYWTFDNGWFLLNTFGMSGQWSSIIGKHPCLIFQLENSSEQMVFNDPRHFGTIKFTNNKKDLDEKLNDLGWDPLADGINDLNINWIKNKLDHSRKCIGELLMNQSLFAGVGNYIRAEALYLSGISPWRPACTLTEKEKLYLCQQVVYVMQESYDHQGATILTYKDAYGAEGKYSSCFKVYGKKEDPLGRKIKKEKTPDGRTIHWCPEVQL